MSMAFSGPASAFEALSFDKHLVLMDQISRIDTYRFESLGEDPKLIFKREQPLAPGWYEFNLDGSFPSEALIKIYLDYGLGFGESCAARLWKDDRTGAYSALVRVPEPLLLIRLDPCEHRCAFEITGFSYLPIPQSRYLMRRARQVGWHGIVDRALAYARGRRPALITSSLGFAAANPTKLDTTSSEPFPSWVGRFDYDDARDRAKLAAAVAALPQQPLISVVMPVYNTPAKLLDEAIDSVVQQIYPNWELCIANDASPKAHVRPQLDRWAARDPRVKVVHRPHNGHICHATNSAFALASGAWIALLDHDDVLRPNALAEVAMALSNRPDAALIYSDEDKIDEKGRRYDANFKPDFSPELFHSMNYLNHLTAHRADLVRAVGGWRPGFEGSQDYDISLRIIERVDRSAIVHIPKVLYHLPGRKKVTPTRPASARSRNM